MEPPIMWEAACGNSSAFWDSQLSWNTTDPELTACFRSTVLVWVPCVVLWLFLPLEIRCLTHSRSGHIRWNLLNITKQIACTILLILFIVKLSVRICYYVHGEDISLAEFCSPAILIASFLLTDILIYYERKKGIQSSALLFFFWLLLTLSETLSFRSILHEARQKMLPEDRINYWMFMIHYPLVISQLILSMFMDTEPLYRNPDDTEENACPLNTSSFLSKLTFSWFDRLLWLGYRKTLDVNDVWKASPEVMTKNTVPQFLHYWTMSNKKKSIEKVIWKTLWPTIIKGWSIRLLGDMLIYASPLLLKKFLAFVSSDEPAWHGYVYIFGMFFATFSESLCNWHGSFYGITARNAVTSSLVSMIYRKSLTLCSSSKLSTTTGEIINHMAVDTDNLADFMYDFVYDMTFVFQICLGLYMLYDLLGVAAFGGLAAMVVMIFISGAIAHQIEKVEARHLKFKDQRIKQINEAILGIKVLKLFAWEKSFIERITGIRQKEAFAKRRGLVFQGVMTLMWRVSTLTVCLVCFTTYVMLDPKNVIDAPTAFITIMLVDILSMPMMRLPMFIALFAQAYVSMRRLNKYMASKDLDPDSITHDEENECAVAVENAYFSWDPNEAPLLSDVNFKVLKGSLVAVVGPVGCGKSSLIYALLGEMEKLKGVINTKGKVAYVPQQAWIQNATVKENVLFGKPLQEKFYKSVIKACALEPDLAILAGGDDTEIGEKGINLSGGQKQRVSLARAVFNDADIYLLDDPLSAVDSHVGEHIFEHVIGPTGLLKDKTRVLVTHGVTHLPKVDEIVVICKGCITEVGTYNQLVERKGAFSEFLATYGQANSAEKKTYTRTESVISKTMSINDDADDDERAKGVKLTTSEHVEEGEVNSSVYFLYLKYIGVWASVGILTLLAISMAFSSLANIWLSIWSSDPVPSDPEKKIALQNMRLAVYATLELSFASVLFAGILTLVYTSMNASINLHSKMLLSIFRSPMSFFDTTPSGRIVNRFSKDVDMVDRVLPNSFQDFLIGALEIISAAIVVCIKLPWLILVFAPVAFLYYLMQKFFIKAADQLRRLESVTRSPIYSRFSETIAGASTVRAFQLQRTFIEQFDEMLDTSLKNKYHFSVLFRWIGVRLDLLGNALVICTALFAMFERGSMDASTIALIITYASAINFTLCWLVFNAGLLESNIISVERLHEYISLKPEASWEQPDRRPSSMWPVQGSVQFKNYSTKYREGLPDVLHGITCEIKDGEKVGVVGRTGAGKSSITLSLFRIIEATEGAIIIDGVDISKIGLHELRNRLTIIPQDPVLYSGSLRMNLDPFDQHCDAELWKALELAHLKQHVLSLAAELQHEIAEGGDNLSVGQRQLVCLARALLRKTKILILDEATAAVDLETDELIQATIRQEFADCTVITIAHRINTILDCSRVIVMDNGSIQEFDHPTVLLNDKKSIFYNMAKFAGLVN